MKEMKLQIKLASEIRKLYPSLVFHSDYGSGAKLTPGQAKQQQALNGEQKAWPDMFFASKQSSYNGLFIELKRDDVRIFKKNGDFSTEHYQQQGDIILKLREQCFAADFARGYNEALSKIIDYMEGNFKETYLCK